LGVFVGELKPEQHALTPPSERGRGGQQPTAAAERAMAVSPTLGIKGQSTGYKTETPLAP